MYQCAWPEVAWLPDVMSSSVTWSRRGSLWKVRCVHAQSEVAQYPPYWGLFTRSKVIKLNVTPKGFHWKGGMLPCTTGSRIFLPIRAYFDRKWRYETSYDPAELPLENMGAHMRDRKCPWVWSYLFSKSYNLIILYELTLSLVICPFTAILFSWGAPSIITFLTKVCCFRICSRLLCSTPRVISTTSAFSLWYFY